MTVEVVTAEAKGDKVVAYAHSKELARKHGWLGGTGSTSAAYLTGLICGFRAVEQGIGDAVFDIGLQHPSKGSRVFAALKGAVDAGLKVPFDKAKLPDEKRITGQHVVEYARLLSSNMEAYQKRFSAQLSAGLKPEETSAHFTQVKEEIVSSLKKAAPPAGKTTVEPEPQDEQGTEEEPEEP
jgi:large subunit ribosomal protein L18